MQPRTEPQGQKATKISQGTHATRKMFHPQKVNLRVDVISPFNPHILAHLQFLIPFPSSI